MQSSADQSINHVITHPFPISDLDTSFILERSPPIYLMRQTLSYSIMLDVKRLKELNRQVFIQILKFECQQKDGAMQFCLTSPTLEMQVLAT